MVHSIADGEGDQTIWERVPVEIERIVTCQGGPCHRKLDRAPFLAGNCGVCDHVCLQIGSLFAWALPREGWNERSCEEKSRGYRKYEGYEASKSWDEEDEGIKRVEKGGDGVGRKPAELLQSHHINCS